MTVQENVFGVVLAGGSGTRFWPASRRALPKQLLPLAPVPGALIEHTVQRLELLCGPVQQGRIWISTGVHLVQGIRHALPKLPEAALLAEPLARNTGPCIAWASARIARLNPKALVIVLPSDHFIRDEPALTRALTTALAVAETGAIVTLGITPTRPEPGYGHIEVGEPIEIGNAATPGVFTTRGFKEKPDLATAKAYFDSGKYLWNAGIFVFRASVLLDAVARVWPELHQGLSELQRAEAQDDAPEAVLRFFQTAPALSIDYGVMEKIDNVRVVPADVGWSDLGSFQVAWELGEKDEHGNVAPTHSVLLDCTNNLVLDLRTTSARSPDNPTQAIALFGVHDCCVVQTDDALLVVPRDRSADLRRLVETLEQRGFERLL